MELDREMELSLKVFNLAGHQVRVLAHGVYGAGRHEFGFDGRGRDTRLLESGVYILKLKTAGIVEVQRTVLLK